MSTMEGGDPQPPRYLDALHQRTREIELSELQSHEPLRAYVRVDIPERFTPSVSSSSCGVTLCLPTLDQTASIAKLLSALATVLHHLQLLSVFPAKKAAFWRAIFPSEMITSMLSRTEVQDWMLEDEQFPSRVVLKVVSYEGDVNESLLERICAFFTAKPDREFRELLKRFPTETGHVRDYSMAVGLAFPEMELRANHVKMVQKLVLDQACGDRRYSLDMLVLNHNDLDAEALYAVADILKKNDIYGLKKVELRNVTGREESLSSDVSSALTAIIQASFGGYPAASSSAREGTQSRQLELLLLSDNYLRVEHYAALCSALRYDKTIVELGLADTMCSGMDVLERAQCWRWIAFGLFYRRSSVTAGLGIRTRKSNLSRSYFTLADTNAFEQTLHDPVELLNCGGSSDLMHRMNSSANTLAAGTLTIRTLKNGAVVRAVPDSASESLLIVQEPMQLECLWVDSDWICVVLPGIGLGWSEADQFERAGEDEESAVSLFETIPEVAVVMNSASWPNSLPLCSFIRCTGSQLVSLELQDNIFMEGVVSAILVFCDKLQQLNLEGWIASFNGSSMCEPEFFDLMRSLRGDFGRKLCSLDLSGNWVDDIVMAALAEDLSASTTPPPALQHLRLCRSWMSEAGLSSLIAALDVNKTVAYLELSKPHGLVHPGSFQPQSTHLEFARLSEKIDGELLRCDPLPLESKLAFLSVTASPIHGAAARTPLDRWMLSSIFGFAGREVRRRIIWR